MSFADKNANVSMFAVIKSQLRLPNGRVVPFNYSAIKLELIQSRIVPADLEDDPRLNAKIANIVEAWTDWEALHSSAEDTALLRRLYAQQIKEDIFTKGLLQAKYRKPMQFSPGVKMLMWVLLGVGYGLITRSWLATLILLMVVYGFLRLHRWWRARRYQPRSSYQK